MYFLNSVLMMFRPTTEEEGKKTVCVPQIQLY